MKKHVLLLFATILGILQINAQTGLDCANAINLSQPSSQVFASGANEHWYKFIATATTAQFDVTQSSSQVNVSKVQLYAGTCSSLTVLNTDSIVSSGDSLATVGNLYLQIGSTYYVRVVFVNNNQNYNYNASLSIPLATPVLILWTNPNGSSGFCGGVNGSVCSTTVCVGESICFAYNIQYPQSGSTNYFNYASNHSPMVFSDGGTITVENSEYLGANPTGCVNYTFNNVGTVTTSTAIGVSSYQFSITVIPANTPPLYAVSPSTNVCIGECVTFTPLNFAQNTSVTSNDPYIPCTTGTPPQPVGNTFIFTNTGVNNIIYTINGGSSCAQTFTIPIVVLSPSIALSSTIVPCTTNGIFNASLNCNNTPSFEWNIYAGNTPSGTPIFTDNNAFNSTINYTFPSTGTYVVQVNYYQNGNIVATTTQTVNITAPPTPTITLLPAFTAPICLGTCKTYTANGALTYTWSTGATGNTVTLCPTVTTVYTVQGTNICGIIGTKTFTLAVYPPIAPFSVTATPNPICLTQSTSLVASPNANTYTWTGVGIGNNITVSPTVTTTYTVLGGNGICPATQTAVITVTVNTGIIPPFAITNALNNFNICANGTGTNVIGFGTNLTNTVGLTYLWDNGSTSPTPNYNITQPQIVNVTVSDGCSSPQTQSVCINYVATQCCNVYPEIAGVINSTVFNNQTLKVPANQTLTINGGVIFNNCNLLMGTNSTIVVIATSTLELQSCNLYSCQGMWYGIRVLSNGVQAGKINLRNTRLEDAYKGIDGDNAVGIMPDISLSVTSTMNKNYIDISIQNAVVYGGINPLLVENSRMISQNSNTSPGTNLKCSGYYTPTIVNHSYAGVLADRAGTVAFTYSIGGNNLIRNKDYGLFFRRTDADVYNVDFRDMIKVLPSGGNPFPLGVGIVSTNAPKYLNVKPATGSTAVNTTFNNIGYGIITSKTPTVDVQRCDFNNPLQSTGLYGDYGISSIDAHGLLRMNYNTMTRVLYGCTANFSVIPTPTTYSMSISNNTISAGNGVSKTAITVNVAIASPMPLGAMVIAANTITRAEFGVFATNVKNGLRISGNTISLSTALPTAFYEGIALGGCDGLMVDNNTITGLQTPAGNANTYNVNSIGIASGTSPNCFIQCNNITRVGTGVAYFGNNATGTGNTGSEFFGNTLNYPIKRGLALIANGIVGTQGNATSASANTWNGFVPLNTANSDQTMVGVSGAASSAINSKLYVRNITGANAERPTDNAFSLPSGPLDAYSTGFGSLISISPTATNIATCTPSLSSGFRVILTPTTSITQRNADYSNYITSVLTATSNATPQQKLILKQHMHKSIRKTSVGANATVANFYTTQQSAEVAKYYEVDSLLGDGNYSLAQTKNNSATASNNITQNHKNYNNIYLNGVASPSDYATLKALAYKCAYEDGNAVYQARALLNTIDYTNIIFIDSCDGSNKDGRMGYFDEGENQGINVAQNIQASLFPNPNNGEFTLAYDLKNVSEATLQLFDVKGSLLLSQVISNENNLTKIDVTNFDNGIYFIKVTSNNTTLWVSKFVINK